MPTILLQNYNGVESDFCSVQIGLLTCILMNIPTSIRFGKRIRNIIHIIFHSKNYSQVKLRGIPTRLLCPRATYCRRLLAVIRQ